MGTNLSKLQETVEDRGAWHAAVHGLQRVGQDLATERQLMTYMKVLVAQSLSHFQLFVTPWTVAHQALLFSIVSQRWLKFMSIGSVMLSSHPLLPSSFPFNLFSIRVFSSESVLYIRWPRYWSFSLSISLSNEYSGLISFRVDSSDLPAIQGTLKSLLQDHNLKASILWCLAFFMVQLSHPHGTTGKIIVLNTCIFFSFV